MANVCVGVLASGRGSNLQAVIDECAAGRIPARIAVVVSDREQAPALERARRHGITAVWLNPKEYASRAAYDAAAAVQLQRYGVDLVVLAGYMRIVTAALIGPFRNRILNIHPSLLPAFPGLHAPRQAFEWGVTLSGCTVHFVDESLDGGPIVIQAAVPVLPDDTVERLEARIQEQEHRILPEAIRLFALGQLRVEGRRVIAEGVAADGMPLLNPCAKPGA